MTGTETTKKLADILSDLISDSGKDLKTLGKEIGISDSALSKYQNDSGEAGINAINKIADYFNVSSDYLIGKTDVKKPSIQDQAIQNEIGLSERSIDILRSHNKNSSSKNSLTSTINLLIEQEAPFSDFLTVDYTNALLSKIKTFLSSQVEKDAICSVTTKGVNSVNHITDIQCNIEEIDTILPTEDIVNSVLLSRIEESLKNLKKEYSLIKYLQSIEENGEV